VTGNLWRLQVALGAAVLAACGAEPATSSEASRPVTASLAPALSPTSSVDAGRATYAAILKTLAVMAAEAARNAPTGQPSMEPDELDLSHCGSNAGDLLGDWFADEPRTTLLTMLAFDMYVLRDGTKPFPPGPWRQQIDDYERAELDRRLAARIDVPPGLPPEERLGAADAAIKAITRDGYEAYLAFLQNLADQLNALRGSRRDLPKVIVVGPCGGGAVSVRIVTDPAGGQVLFIPTFFYELCRAQAIDPEDPAKCRRWREALSSTLTSVSGDYQFIARWADGAVRRGKLSITDNQDGRTITLGKLK
jgi:hypothetical protein